MTTFHEHTCAAPSAASTLVEAPSAVVHGRAGGKLSQGNVPKLWVQAQMDVLNHYYAPVSRLACSCCTVRQCCATLLLW